jgi:hypothetical protein
MLLSSILFRLVRSLLGLTAVLVRRRPQPGVELLVLRHENAVLRCQTSWVRYACSADLAGSAALSRLCRATAGPRFSRSRPLRSWPATAGWFRGDRTTLHAADPDVYSPPRRSGNSSPR